MLLILLVFLVVALVLVGVGVGVGLVASVVGGLLLGLGVVSSSVAVGLYSGRPALAMRTFLWQCGVLAGGPAGAVGAWLTQSLFTTAEQTTWKVVAGGALDGAAGGWCAACLLDFCLRRLGRWAAAKPRGVSSNQHTSVV